MSRASRRFDTVDFPVVNPCCSGHVRSFSLICSETLEHNKLYYTYPNVSRHVVVNLIDLPH